VTLGVNVNRTNEDVPSDDVTLSPGQAESGAWCMAHGFRPGHSQAGHQ
jgi:hypothetical protein